MNWDEKKNLASKLKTFLTDTGCYRYEENKKNIALNILKKQKRYCVAVCIANIILWVLISYYTHNWFFLPLSLATIFLTTTWFSGENREKKLKKDEPVLQNEWQQWISIYENQKTLIDLLYELKDNLIATNYYNSILDLIVEKKWDHLLRVLLHLQEDINSYITNTEAEEEKEKNRDAFLRQMYEQPEQENTQVVRKFTIIKEEQSL